MKTSVKKHKSILNRNKSALLIIDIQKKILSVMPNKDRLIENAVKLIQGAKRLNIPVFFTEQYPKGLGPTNALIKKGLEPTEAIQKMSFSCSGAGDLFEDLKSFGIKQLIVSGIESHVCVQQTVLDLIANGFQVDVAADAVDSRNKIDYDIALHRMRSNGAEITTTESILFELLQICGTEEFKSISKLIK